MRKTTIRYTKGILIAAIALLLVFKLLWLNKINFDIDTLGTQLVPVQKYIKPGSRTGFYTNIADPALFMSINYIMAPQPLLQNYTTDTVLLIQNKTIGIKIFEHYHSIVQNQDGDRIVSLIIKDK